MMSMDEKYMKEAIRQAKKAYALDETPIGCVIVHEGNLITGSKPNGPTQAANTASELKGRTLPAIKEPRKRPQYPQSIRN